MTYRLSLLDKSPIPPGVSTAQALRSTLAMAQRAEALGYHRFWVAEHHGNPQVAGSAPEILVAWLLAHTQRIRIGSGGVMLQHYSPYKVAEVFKLLSALAPGRVDLGIGKAPGGLPQSTRALQARHDPSQPINFDSLLSDLNGFLRDDLPAGHPLAASRALPKPSTLPQCVLLGASPDSAQLASRLGWGFSYAGHFNDDPALLASTTANRARRRRLLMVDMVCAVFISWAGRAGCAGAKVRIHKILPQRILCHIARKPCFPRMVDDRWKAIFEIHMGLRPGRHSQPPGAG